MLGDGSLETPRLRYMTDVKRTNAMVLRDGVCMRGVLDMTLSMCKPA